MRRITIKETRISLKEQIVEILQERDNFYSFEENKQENVDVTLISGQQLPCSSVELRNDLSLVFNLSLLNVQDIEVSESDITIESLDKIISKISVCKHYVDIHAVDKYSSPVLLFTRDLNGLPDDCVGLLREIIPCDWEKAPVHDFGDMAYVFYPEKRNQDSYLVAHFG